MNEWHISRRKFLQATGFGIAGIAVAGPAWAASAYLPPSEVDTGAVKDGKINFPEWKGSHDKPSGPAPSPLPWDERVGFAVVALGRLSIENILPAFAQTKKAKVVALVSGSPDKAALLAKQYGVKKEAVYSYENFEQLKDNPEVKAVYIVLPNSMHREFVERAAKIGKHILCEKPMATSVADAKAMVDASKAANVKLMIAYRCQYEVYNRKLQDIVRSGEYGPVRFIEADNSQSQGTPEQWRLKKAMAGGGALPDIGIYCLNAARFITGEEPIEVFAHSVQPKNDARFKEVEERISFMLKFPSGVLANCNSSYDAHESKDLCVRMQKGWIKLDGAYAYKGKSLKIGKIEDKQNIIEEIKLEEKNHFALEIDHMAECVKENRVPRTPGEEGLQDQILMEAIYKSAASGEPIRLNL